MHRVNLDPTAPRSYRHPTASPPRDPVPLCLVPYHPVSAAGLRPSRRQRAPAALPHAPSPARGTTSLSVRPRPVSLNRRAPVLDAQQAPSPGSPRPPLLPRSPELPCADLCVPGVLEPSVELAAYAAPPSPPPPLPAAATSQKPRHPGSVQRRAASLVSSPATVA